MQRFSQRTRNTVLSTRLPFTCFWGTPCSIQLECANIRTRQKRYPNANNANNMLQNHHFTASNTKTVDHTHGQAIEFVILLHPKKNPGGRSALFEFHSLLLVLPRPSHNPPWNPREHSIQRDWLKQEIGNDLTNLTQWDTQNSGWIATLAKFSSGNKVTVTLTQIAVTTTCSHSLSTSA